MHQSFEEFETEEKYWWKRPDGVSVLITKAAGQMGTCCEELVSYMLETIHGKEQRLNTVVGIHCVCDRVVQPEDIGGK